MKKSGYPPILYTDEDKLSEAGVSQPYFKPDWDPVLLGNLAYIAHLGVVNREEALRLGSLFRPRHGGQPGLGSVSSVRSGRTRCRAYPRSGLQLANAFDFDSGRCPFEVVHHDFAAGSSCRTSFGQRTWRSSFEVENSPFFPGAPHWHFVRKHTDPRPITCSSYQRIVKRPRRTSRRDLDLRSDPRSLLSLARNLVGHDELVCVRERRPGRRQRALGWEARGLFELYPDTVMIGGLIRNRSGENSWKPGFNSASEGLCGSPDRGRKEADPGYFGQAWKQRSVSAVSVQFAVLRTVFLLDALRESAAAECLCRFLVPGWVRTRCGSENASSTRPFLEGVISSDWEHLISTEEKELFTSAEPRHSSRPAVLPSAVVAARKATFLN